MRAHKITFAALVVAAGLSLTACQNDDDAAAQTDPSTVATASPSSGGTGSGGSDQASPGASSGGKDTSAGSGSGSDESGKAAKCRTDGLKITAIDNFIDGDPKGTVAVEMKNSSGRDCVIAGFAGVDLKTNEGTLSAERKGAPGEPYVLKNGKSIAFSVTYPLNETGGTGVRITGLVVTPPNETKSVTLAWPGKPSLPVTDGSGEPVTVGPIGSAGQGG
ncbi:DUF4232 domain-containing protein [Streptomyces sp. SID9124]|uniref:DUF4232 domain-containing protein n=1 Tax=Streptomyces sp. SID9124 TaxID=2706108 RepID=UPI0013DFE24F|nr:DUF4232 domain-containing protein [Streptomyces sp. SID9124]NED11149.1 DUF4232 domain-containing protein [Streptomyces sp. SID9124]